MPPKKPKPKGTPQIVDDPNESQMDSKNKIAEIEDKIKKKLEELSGHFDGVKSMPLFLGGREINSSLVDDVFDELRINHKDCDGRLNVIIESGGGDLDAAYNISLLLRRYASEELNFIIPRWSKSAATLLACAGDNIYMTPVAEMGPLDPQITQFNPIEKRLEQFSPLSIEATLGLIRDEFKNGNDKLGNAFMQRLQFPLTLGGFKKSLEDAVQYLEKLLNTRMFKDEPDGEEKLKKIKNIADHLVKNYSHHGYCINVDEAKSIGLRAHILEGEKLDLVWEIHKLNKEKSEMESQQLKTDMLKNFPGGMIPPELLSSLTPEKNNNHPNNIVNKKILN